MCIYILSVKEKQKHTYSNFLRSSRGKHIFCDNFLCCLLFEERNTLAYLGSAGKIKINIAETKQQHEYFFFCKDIEEKERRVGGGEIKSKGCACTPSMLIVAIGATRGTKQLGRKIP